MLYNASLKKVFFKIRASFARTGSLVDLTHKHIFNFYDIFELFNEILENIEEWDEKMNLSDSL